MAANGLNPLLFGDPTSQVQLDQIQRNQKLAQALLDQSQQQPQGQMVGDRFVRPSWTQGLAQLLKAYVGRKGLEDADSQLAKVQTQAMGNLASRFGAAQGTPGPAATQPSSTDNTTATPDATQAATQAAPQAPTQGSEQTPRTEQTLHPQSLGAALQQYGSMTLPGMQPNQAMSTYLMNPEKYMETYLTGYKPTDKMLNDKYLGISPAESASAQRAQQKKEGMFSPTPGSTTYDLQTGSSMFAPKVPDGMQADTQGRISVAPGFTDATSQIAAAQKGAEADAAAARDLVTIKTPQGDVMLPRSEALRIAGGQQQTAQPVQPSSNGYASGSKAAADKGTLQILGQEWAKNFLQLDSAAQNPALQQNARENLQALAREVTRAGGDVSQLPRWNQAQSMGIAGAVPGAVNGKQRMPGIALKSDADMNYEKERLSQAATYENSMNDRVRQGQDLNMRLQESLGAMEKFRAGGGAETRATVARYAQALGMPGEVVNGIAGGNLASMQEFQKLAVQQAMEQLKQATASSNGTGGKITQAEFQVFQKNNPNLDTDPNAIRKIYDFQTRLFNRDLQEQQSYGQFRKEGNNPADFPGYWSGELTKRGFTNPQLQANKPTTFKLIGVQ